VARGGVTARATRRPSVRAGGSTRCPADGMDTRGNGNHHDTMQIPGVHIETLHNPVRYTYAQIEKACAIAQMLNRGKLVLVEPPRR
jgi:hypothetical protein